MRRDNKSEVGKQKAVEKRQKCKKVEAEQVERGLEKRVKGKGRKDKKES